MYAIEDKGVVLVEGETPEKAIEKARDYLIESYQDEGYTGDFEDYFDLVHPCGFSEEVTISFTVEPGYDWQSNNGTLNKAMQGV
jgi:hypothetical protein